MSENSNDQKQKSAGAAAFDEALAAMRAVQIAPVADDSQGEDFPNVDAMRAPEARQAVMAYYSRQVQQGRMDPLPAAYHLAMTLNSLTMPGIRRRNWTKEEVDRATQKLMQINWAYVQMIDPVDPVQASTHIPGKKPSK